MGRGRALIGRRGTIHPPALIEVFQCLHLCGNTGTYVDSPLHRHRGAADLADLPLEHLAHLPVHLIDARKTGRSVGPELFQDVDVRGAALPRDGGRLHAVPIAWRGGATFPVRAYVHYLT